MKFIVRLDEVALANFYTVHSKIMQLFGFRDAYFIYQKQRIYISGLPSEFFNSLINWVGMQVSLLVFTYVAYVESNVRNTYTQFGAYFTNTAVWFLPFNFYSEGLIYWDSASQIRSGNDYYNILACAKFIVAPVKERNDLVLTGGDTLLVYDENGNIVPPKKQQNGSLYPVQKFTIRNPQSLKGLLFTFVDNKGTITFNFDDQLNSNYKVTGTKTYAPTDEKSFNFGLPLWRDENLPYQINQRSVTTTNLDYIQSFEDAFCGATITAFPVTKLLSPYILNADFRVSQLKIPITVNNPITYQTDIPIAQYVFSWKSKNNAFSLILRPSNETLEQYTITSSTALDKNNNIYAGTSNTATVTIKNFNTPVSTPYFNAYQFSQQDGLVKGSRQGYYENGIIISSPKYICFQYVVQSSDDLLFFKSTQQNLAIDIIFNMNYLTKNTQVYSTASDGLAIKAQIFINMYKVDGTDISKDEYETYFTDKALNYVVYMFPVSVESTATAVQQIATEIEYSPIGSKVYYRTNFPSYDIKLLWTSQNIVYQIKQITSQFQEIELLPLSNGKYMFLIVAKTIDQAKELGLILANPGDYPLLVDNLPNYNNLDVLNLQQFPNSSNVNLFSQAVSKSNYAVYTSGYYGEGLKWVISKYTEGISAGKESDCAVSVLNTGINRTYYELLKEFSASGPLPFEFVISSKTIRNGIRMFNDIFNHNSNLEREISAYTTILIKPKSWTYDAGRNLYISNRLLWPQLWPRFKYGAFIGFNESYSKNYSVIFSDLERVIYYLPKPFTLRTNTDTYILCREIELRNQFIIEADTELKYVLLIVSNYEGRTIKY